MSFNLVEYSITLPAQEDLSSDQYKFLVQDASSAKMRKPVSTTEYLTGILANIPSATDPNTDALYQLPPTVVLSGVTRVRCAYAMAVGTFVTAAYSSSSTDLTGCAVSASGGYKYARAVLLEAATSNDDIVACRLIDQNPS